MEVTGASCPLPAGTDGTLYKRPGSFSEPIPLPIVGAVRKKTYERLPVSAGDRYRAKALELLARAEFETDPQIRTGFENLAAAFLRLAEQAERNAALTVEFELPPQKESDPKL